MKNIHQMIYRLVHWQNVMDRTKKNHVIFVCICTWSNWEKNVAANCLCTVIRFIMLLCRWRCFYFIVPSVKINVAS